MKSYPLVIILLFSMLSIAQDLPRNPIAGECYVRCRDERGKSLEWKTIDCDLVLKENALNIKNLSSGVLSEKDRKVIKKKLIKILKKGYTIELLSHYFSTNSDSINEKRAIQNGTSLYTYLETKGINTKQLLITAYGNSKPLIDCPDSISCPEYYNQNTRMEYRVVNATTLENVKWTYDNEKKVWCYKAIE